MPEMQMVPARHGVATFVPAGQTIKIVNTHGTQVVDTWAFALPHPDVKNGEDENEGQQEAPKKEELSQSKGQKEEEKPAKGTPAKKSRSKSGIDLPSQEDAEKATKEGIENGDGQGQQQQAQGQKKNTWSSYVPSVPSIGWSGKNGAKQEEQQAQQGEKGETEKQKNSRTWASYMPSGKGYSSYIPKGASDTVSSFATTVSEPSGAKVLNQTLTVLSARKRPEQVLH